MDSPTVLITGATGGIGKAFAERFAVEECDLILVARNLEQLQHLAEQLEQRYGVNVKVFACDLSDHVARQQLLQQISVADIDVLINNAGFGQIEHVTKTDTEQLISMVGLNCAAVTHFASICAKAMQEKGSGTIVNVASTAAFQPVPSFAVYAATKAFVLSFTQALAVELDGSGVQIQALCPGPTESGFWKVANAEKIKLPMRTAQDVVETSLAALKDKQVVAIDGKMNRWGAKWAKRVPVGVAMRFANRMITRKPK